MMHYNNGMSIKQWLFSPRTDYASLSPNTPKQHWTNCNAVNIILPIVWAIAALGVCAAVFASALHDPQGRPNGFLALVGLFMCLGFKFTHHTLERISLNLRQ